jgi:hypothetical protein
LRIPDAWNGRLVIAGTPGQRSEYACDALFGDPLLARGYAYACGNKGNGDGVALLAPGSALHVGGVAMPRFALPNGYGLGFWQHAFGHTMQRWLDETLQLAVRARELLEQLCGRVPEATYGIGLSNGGYQIRRAIESSDLFDGALLWNAVLWTEEQNVLRSIAGALAAVAAGRPGDAVRFGFPPDVTAADGTSSLYAKNLAAYWTVTLWLHAMQLDPETSIAYGDVDVPEPSESWIARLSNWRYDRSPEIARRVAAFANTGAVACKTIDVASEYDHLIPPAVHHEPYANLVRQAGASDRYRARILPMAQHVDPWSEDLQYPSMRPGYPGVMRAWDELVAWVEGGATKNDASDG